MMAAGYSLASIRKIVFGEHTRILLAGIFTGLVSALVATRPSVMNDAEIPWKTVLMMIIMILITGFTALFVSVKSINKESLISRIRKE
jgi:hypothetical protein